MDEFKPIPEDGEAIGASSDKPGAYAGGEKEDLSPEAPKEPNSFYLPLGRQHGKERRPSISWQSDNPIMVLALIMLVLILLLMAVCAICLVIQPNSTGLAEMIKVLGQAVLILVGVIGGAASSANRT